MLKISRATPADFAAILALQEPNLVSNLAENKRGDGFVTTPFTPEILAALQAPDGFCIARTSGGELAGYVFMGSWAFLARWPIFQVMSARFPLSLAGQPLNEGNSFQYGPVCVSAPFRGAGVLPALVAQVKAEMRPFYPLGATFINQKNGRSMSAHERKLGFVPVDEWEFGGQNFTTLAFGTS